jgi:hypothetical protein
MTSDRKPSRCYEGSDPVYSILHDLSLLPNTSVHNRSNRTIPVYRCYYVLALVFILLTPLATNPTGITVDMDLSIRPNAVNVDYSPSNESFSPQDLFDQEYLANWYATLSKQPPNIHSNTFLDESYFRCSVPSFDLPVSEEYPSGLQSTSLSGQSELNFAPSVNTASILDTNVPITPDITVSPAYSPCDEDALATPPLSPLALKCGNPKSSTPPGEEPTLKRRRGRPKLKRGPPDSIDILSPKRHQCVSRVPHNQVERKYREGLNSELARLSSVVPALSWSDKGAELGQPKPTKAMVISYATELIITIGSDNDELRKENEQLVGQIRRKMCIQSNS